MEKSRSVGIECGYEGLMICSEPISKGLRSNLPSPVLKIPSFIRRGVPSEIS